MNVLIVGGTSGLGLELAKIFHKSGSEVYVTGRHDPNEPTVRYLQLDLTTQDIALRIKEVVELLPKIDTFIYAAGYYQEGLLTDLSEAQIEEMFNVGGRGLVYFAKSILKKQKGLNELVTITSTSQWIPRKLEPVYSFVKAGSAHFSNSLAEDERIGKVLVAGPTGMKTVFWDGSGRDESELSKMLSPEWVAGEIAKLLEDEYSYRFAKIMRGPKRVEIVETR